MATRYTEVVAHSILTRSTLTENCLVVKFVFGLKCKRSLNPTIKHETKRTTGWKIVYIAAKWHSGNVCKWFCQCVCLEPKRLHRRALDEMKTTSHFIYAFDYSACMAVWMQNVKAKKMYIQKREMLKTQKPTLYAHMRRRAGPRGRRWDAVVVNEALSRHASNVMPSGSVVFVRRSDAHKPTADDAFKIPVNV